MAHNLCDRCRHLSFSLHEAELCERLNCENKSVTVKSVSLHSNLILHYPNLGALEASSRSGCHLCSLINAGLQSASRMPTRWRITLQEGVFVWFECRTSSAPYKRVTEDLYATCGSAVASFEVGTLPKTYCTDYGFYDKQALYMDRDEGSVKFRTVCMNRDFDSHLPNPGAYCDIFDVQGDFWLARSASFSDPLRHRSKPKQWVHREQFGKCTYPIHSDCACGKGVWEARRLERFEFGSFHTSFEAMVPLIQDWMTICDTGHSRCVLSAPNTYPSRVIEITEPGGNFLRLIDGASCNSGYATLSYRWGDTASSGYITKESNLKTRKMGFQKDSLPRTIQDAITVEQWLEIRYVWIDAICIIQDSHDDWKTEGSRMDQIYLASCLTISADSALDVTTGFLHKRNPLTWKSCIHPSLVAPYEKPTPGFFSGHDSNLFLSRPSSPGLPVPQAPRYICCGIAPATVAMSTSILSERGWILQERLLSRRILHWGVYEVFWECNEMVASERLPAGHGESLDSLNWDWRNVGSYEEWNRFRRMLHSQNHAGDDDNQTAPSSTEEFDIWHRLVQKYTSRKLTVLSDRLPAISGLSNAFGKFLSRSLSDYIFGLWRQTLFSDLCWMRRPTHPTSKTQNEKPSRILGVPSFSWASVSCPVSFLPGYLLSEAVELPELVTLGTALTVSGSVEPAPSMKLRSLLFEIDILAKKLPGHNPDDSDGMVERIMWDDPTLSGDINADRNIVCLCLGITKYIDHFMVSESKRLFGMLLQPLPDLDTNGNGKFLRVGFYSGLLPHVNVRDMERRIVTIF